MKKQRKRIAIIITAAVSYVLSAAAMAVGDHSAPGALVGVGSHRLHIDCLGDGRPTIILDSGMGGSSLDWTRVRPAIAEFTRVCSYDRAGYGWSENGPLPRTGARLAEELHELVARAEIAAPYVLVGHSFAGFIVRLFAGKYPDETAGLVLVDASHENQFEMFRRDRTAPDIRPSWMFMRANRPRVPVNMPAEVVETARQLAATRSAYIALQGEMQSFVRSAEQVRMAPALPDVPLIVLTRGRQEWGGEGRGPKMERLWLELQRELTYSTPRSIHLVARESGHYIHLDQPEIVVDSVRAITDIWRDTNPAAGE
jgi:pimeloyl-ACP methyl ester carboxylesterase